MIFDRMEQLPARFDPIGRFLKPPQASQHHGDIPDIFGARVAVQHRAHQGKRGFEILASEIVKRRGLGGPDVPVRGGGKDGRFRFGESPVGIRLE